MSQIDEMIGRRFERLLVLEFSRLRQTTRMYRCVCDCGTERIVAKYSLTSGDTKSCGCYARDRISKANKTHGLNRTPEHKAWLSMKNRCLLESDRNFHNYGGRGIKVCDKWLASFEAFHADMGDRPSPKHSLDRIDVNGNYEPSNCRWADRKTQDNNTVRTVYLDFQGQTKPLTIWCEELGLNPLTVWGRINKLGWSTEKALTTRPKDRYRRRESR